MMFHPIMAAPLMALRRLAVVTQAIVRPTAGWLRENRWRVVYEKEEKEFTSLKKAVAHYKRVRKLGAVLKIDDKPLSEIRISGKSALSAALDTRPNRLNVIAKLIIEITERRNREDEDFLLLTLTLQ